MNHANNLALIEVSKVWEIDGDWMRCRACRAVLIASRDGEPLRHKTECKNAAHVHPWSDLRKAMDVTPVQTGAVGSVPGWKLVPVEPTLNMWEAFFRHCSDRHEPPMAEFHTWTGDFGNFVASYDYMLSASPSPPALEGNDDFIELAHALDWINMQAFPGVGTTADYTLSDYMLIPKVEWDSINPDAVLQRYVKRDPELARSPQTVGGGEIESNPIPSVDDGRG